jgi:type VI secretion system secreted protein Hcp
MAVDILLQLNGIKGESQDKTYPGAMQLMSFSWGMSQTGAPSGGGSGKVSVHDISITKVTDSSSPQLMLSCVSGKPITGGIIAIRKAGDKPLEYFKIKLTDVLISSFQTGGHSSGTPSEEVTLDFAKAQFSIAPISRAGVLGQPFLVTILNSEHGEVVIPPS